MTTVEVYQFLLENFRANTAEAFDVQFISGKVDDEYVVVLYTRSESPALHGRRLDIKQKHAYYGEATSAYQLADFLFIEEFLEPSGSGSFLDVDWAVGLVPDPFRVRWHGAG